MEDALRVVGVAVEDKLLVAGGGAPEVELALRLRAYASTVGGREQLAIESFADAMEIIPKTLAENAGLDQIDTLVSLRSQHESGLKTSGLDMDSGKPMDMAKLGVLEPLRVKTQAISSAAEAAVMILRIDDVIASKSGGEEACLAECLAEWVEWAERTRISPLTFFFENLNSASWCKYWGMFTV